MIIIDRKDDESIDRVLKRYKNKHRRVEVVKELRKRKEFVKPSVRRRETVLKAIYRRKKYGDMD